MNGRLTQLQYQAILARIDQVLLLLPVLQKLGSVNTNIEKPKIPTIVLFKIERGDWTLCNDLSVKGEEEKIELLAGLNFQGIQLCVEVLEKRQVVKFFVQNVGLHALPNHENNGNSQLFNPNSFIFTGSPQPLFAFRFKNISHGPGELLEPVPEGTLETAATTVRKFLGNRAFYDGERSNLDIRLTSLHSGINPNPACNILNFFLKSEINIQRLITTVRQAKSQLEKSLEKVDISAMASEFAAEFKVDSFVESVKHSLDMDIRVDISDTRLYLVQDIPDSDMDTIHGNISLVIKRILFDQHVEGKFKHVSLFQIDSVDINCNKQEQGVVSSQAIFTPVSCKFHSDREWLLDNKEWVMQVNGFFDKINLEVNPSHARVFMDVIHGVKIDNIRNVINSIVSNLSNDIIHKVNITSYYTGRLCQQSKNSVAYY